MKNNCLSHSDDVKESNDDVIKVSGKGQEWFLPRETMEAASKPCGRSRKAEEEDMLAERRRILAAKRRLQQLQLLDRSLPKVPSPPKENCEDNDYEEIEIRKEEEEDEHHYLTPILRGKSNSDSNLLLMDKELELLCCSTESHCGGGVVKDVTFGGCAEPEQGFYRVYDDLERVRQWDLIPYVITRKMREQQLASATVTKGGGEQQEEAASSKPATTEIPQHKTVVTKGSSRVSLDSGRASIVSSTTNATRTKRLHSDSGSNCSADSGTYNLFDDNHLVPNGAAAAGPPPPPPPAPPPPQKRIDNLIRGEPFNADNFIRQVSAQLDSIQSFQRPVQVPAVRRSHVRPKRRVVPPPPPSLMHEIQPLGIPVVSPPPPLPPRAKKPGNPSVVSIRRKDLSSYFGLLEDEPNELLSKEVVQNVALRNLSPKMKAELNKESPPSRKDLNKFLGIEGETTTTSPSTTSCKSSAAKKRQQQKGHASEETVGEREKAKGKDEEATGTANGCNEDFLSSPSKENKAALSLTPSSCRRELKFSPLHKGANMTPTTTEKETKSVQTSNSPHLRRSGFNRRRRSAGPIGRILKCNPLSNARAASPARSASLNRRRSSDLRSVQTPVARFKSKELPRRSFMASLLLSGSKKKSEREKSEDATAEIVPEKRDYSQDVDEARRLGLPVIPFMQTPVTERRTIPATSPSKASAAAVADNDDEDSNNNNNSNKEDVEMRSLSSSSDLNSEDENAKSSSQFSGEAPFAKTAVDGKQEVRWKHQQSSLYLTMKGRAAGGCENVPPPMAVRALATPSGGDRYPQQRLIMMMKAADEMRSNFGKHHHHHQQQQHCESCTCSISHEQHASSGLVATIAGAKTSPSDYVKMMSAGRGRNVKDSPKLKLSPSCKMQLQFWNIFTVYFIISISRVEVGQSKSRNCQVTA